MSAQSRQLRRKPSFTRDAFERVYEKITRGADLPRLFKAACRGQCGFCVARRELSRPDQLGGRCPKESGPGKHEAGAASRVRGLRRSDAHELRVPRGAQERRQSLVCAVGEALQRLAYRLGRLAAQPAVEPQLGQREPRRRRGRVEPGRLRRGGERPNPITHRIARP